MLLFTGTSLYKTYANINFFESWVKCSVKGDHVMMRSAFIMEYKIKKYKMQMSFLFSIE